MMKKQIGLNFSHYEFDHDLLDDDGNIENITLKGVGAWEPLENAFKNLDVMRFMNWQKTNISTWLRRPPYSVGAYQKRDNRANWRQPAYHKGVTPPSIDWQYSEGVPLKICLHVAKQCRANPWICIPHGWKPRTIYDVDATYCQHHVE